MKICFLVLAHNNRNHFGRLLEAITSEQSRVVVHVDAKVDDFHLRRLAWDYSCSYVDSRVAINWGGWSMVHATLRLLKTAIHNQSPADYYCLLSGSDYPIRSLPAMLQYLEENAPDDFINSVAMPNELVDKPISRITKPYWEPSPVQSLLARGANRFKRQLNPIFHQIPYERPYRRILGVQPQCGSQWWALSRGSVETILKMVEDRPKLVKFFEHTFIPDESLFQTLLYMAPAPNRIRRNLTFTDWTRPNPPYPAIIDDEHIDHLLSTEALKSDVYGTGPLFFARKFPDDSSELVARIQATLWKTSIPSTAPNP